MTTLRALVRAVDGPDAALPWALYDAAGAVVAEGSGPAAEWPAADVLEFVVAAGDVRLVALPLPPMPAARVPAAAAFALEDQLAGPASDHWLAVAPERLGGCVVVAVTSRGFVAALRARAAVAPQAGRLERVLAEPELAGADGGWCWCVPADSPDGAGFVRLPDGSAFTVSPRGHDGSLPAELVLALGRTERDGGAAAIVRVDVDCDDAAIARWQADGGASFVRGRPWQWRQASPAAFASATNLLQRELAPAREVPTGNRLRPFVPGLVLAAAALLLHLGATVGEWAWWRIDTWRTNRAIVEAALGAGVAAESTGTVPDALAALTARYAEVRHARGLSAPDDALPLLARASSALALLPPGTLKSASYAGGHWTLELTGLDGPARAELDARLRQSGTPAIAAPTANGVRLRIGVLR